MASSEENYVDCVGVWLVKHRVVSQKFTTVTERVKKIHSWRFRERYPSPRERMTSDSNARNVSYRFCDGVPLSWPTFVGNPARFPWVCHKLSEVWHSVISAKQPWIWNGYGSGYGSCRTLLLTLLPPQNLRTEATLLVVTVSNSLTSHGCAKIRHKNRNKLFFPQ